MLVLESARCGRGEIGKHSRLHSKPSAKYLSASREILGVELLKFGETLTDNADGNPEPSL